MSKTPPPSLSAANAVAKLGSDIANARKRRRLTQKRLAEGAGLSIPTIRRLEEGDAGISLGNLAMVLLVLGETSRLANLLDAGQDDVGLILSAQQLPKRVRSAGRSVPPTSAATTSGDNVNGDTGEAF